MDLRQQKKGLAGVAEGEAVDEAVVDEEEAEAGAGMGEALTEAEEDGND